MNLQKHPQNTLHTNYLALTFQYLHYNNNKFTMVALDDMTSNVPELVVPEGDNEVSDLAAPYVNAVYFTNWCASLSLGLSESSTNQMQGYLWAQLPASEPSRFATDPRTLCFHERES